MPYERQDVAPGLGQSLLSKIVKDVFVFLVRHTVPLHQQSFLCDKL